MNRPNLFSIATLHQVPSLISGSPLWPGFPVVLLVLGLFAFSPMARAVDPPPDGGYPGKNTAEGDNALNSLTTGQANTAVGFQALFENTTGNYNTAAGYGALLSNTTGAQNTAFGVSALSNNTTGINNTANGIGASRTTPPALATRPAVLVRLF